MLQEQALPPVVLGTWGWGNDGTFGGRYESEELKRVFDRGMELGFSFWDTAAVYGDGQAEATLGRFLKNYPRVAYQISAKLTPQHARSAKLVLQESMDRLGIQVPDYYFLHNPADFTKWLPALISLAKNDKINKIGLSNFHLDEIKQAKRLLEENNLTIGAVQNHYSLVHRFSEETGILDYCRAEGIPFFAYMILEQGALTGRFDRRHPFPEGSERGKNYNPVLEKLELFNNLVQPLAEEHQATMAQLMMAWAMAKKTVPMIGVTGLWQVEEIAGVLRIRLSETEIMDLERFAARVGLKTTRVWEYVRGGSYG